jgi:predicted dehydrogenase
MEKTQIKQFNLAFLGCGFATRIHSKTLSHFKQDFRLHYASRDKAKADSYNEKYKGNGSFGSYKSAIDSPAIDTVLIATPPAQHLELALRAMEARKNVIVEKPPFLNSSDLKTIVETQKKTDCRVYVAENYYYKPLARKLREIIRANWIGEILFVHVNALKQQEALDWRNNSKLAGGGALFEGGIHWINFIANLGLNLKSLKGFRPGKKEGLERSLMIDLEFAEGAIGTLYYSWETPSLLKGLCLSKIYGKKGSITFESNGLFILVSGSRNRLFFPGIRDIAGYKAMFRDFIHSLRTGKKTEMTLDAAQKDLQYIETIYQSMGNQDK